MVIFPEVSCCIKTNYMQTVLSILIKMQKINYMFWIWYGALLPNTKNSEPLYIRAFRRLGNK